MRKKKKLGSYPFISVIFSISLALFVIGLFGLLMLHANKLTDLVRENIEVQVYLNRTITENERIKIQKTLSTKEYILQKEGEPQVRYISKEEAAEQFIQDTGEDFTQFLGENPLRDAFVLTIQPDFFEPEQLKVLKADIEGISGVFEVTYLENFIASLNKNLTKVSLTLIGFAVLLVFIVMILINNTIRLALFSQRFLIRSMQLVGATKGFIQRPFLMRSLLHGLLGGFFASIFLMLVLEYANRQISDLHALQDPEKIYLLMGFLFVLGGFLGLVSSYRAIRKYLRLSLDELY
jgi:cell division transport system permease protein